MKNSTQVKLKTSKFTLIELLVILAIIAILAAILFLSVDGHIKSMKPMTTVTPNILYLRDRRMVMPSADTLVDRQNMEFAANRFK